MKRAADQCDEPSAARRSRPCVCALPGAEPALVERAAQLARTLDLPLRDSEQLDASWLALCPTPLGLELREGELPRRRGARVDFAARGLSAGRAGGARWRRQPIARAVGRAAGRVVDCTSGFGDDSILLASLGHAVLALDRSPIAVALLEDGRRRAALDPALAEIAARIEVREADAIAQLPVLDFAPSCVYIDPMFPPKRSKSALPRRPIQLLRRLVGDDADADRLLAAALASSAERVVVKRALRDPPLGHGPSAQFAGKLVRYDVYTGPERRRAKADAR